ncbi:MAG: hypothetical protein QM809_11140 [Gordonia sp. (in: high G+C Gram-positive bacteria)]|uniref:hypothetical protein n=1 Tax=Gordonia sp. (in: high G+C Gram-positive bacteria) TaxID=84139 RepID=UPI0039E5129C
MSVSQRHRSPAPKPERTTWGVPARWPVRVFLAVVSVLLIVVAASSAWKQRPTDVPAAAPTTQARTTDPSSEAPGVRLDDDRLHAAFARLRLKTPTGIALAPVGGGTPVLLGDQTIRDAWSTIKIPLALAAERRNGQNRSETKAIVDSDNRSARRLTRSLGSPGEAVDAVTSVLREGGDARTLVLPATDDDEWPHLGETLWALSDSALWTAKLPCMDGSEHILALMAQVGRTQNWGLRKASSEDAAVKGGWGVDERDRGYLVRQIGILTLDDGSRVAVSMSVHAPKMSYDTGVTVMNTLGRWLGRHRALLPGGRCPGPPAVSSAPASSTPAPPTSTPPTSTPQTPAPQTPASPTTR